MSWTGIVRYRVTTILIAAFAAQIIACGEEDGGTTAGGGTQQDASADATVDARADATEVGNDADEGGVTSCAPKTCAQFGANCGSAPDGCGEVIECGVCAAGQTCGGAGTNKCGTDTCAPKSCVQVGAECGWAPDGCAEAIDCGACMAPDTCGGAGVDNQCGCSCTRDHAQTQCLAGVCSIDVCDSGWGDGRFRRRDVPTIRATRGVTLAAAYRNQPCVGAGCSEHDSACVSPISPTNKEIFINPVGCSFKQMRGVVQRSASLPIRCRRSVSKRRWCRCRCWPVFNSGSAQPRRKR